MRAQILIPLLAAVVGRTNAQSITDLLAATPELSELLNAASQYPDLVDALGAATDITIFAPVNSAFADLPANLDADFVRAVLTYHVAVGRFAASSFTYEEQFLPTLLQDPAFSNVTGGQVLKVEADDGSVYINDDFMVNVAGSVIEAEATVLTADIMFDGGIVHLIDSVLIPPTPITETLGTPQTANTDTSTLLSLIANSPTLSDAVPGLSDITVFAPTNAALGAVDTSGFSQEQIDNILTYHVINGTVAYSTTLQSGNVTTLQGGDVQISLTGDRVTVNGINVVLTDVLTASGVIHVIDGVLVPGQAVDTPPVTDDDDDTPDEDGDDTDADEGQVPANSAPAQSSATWALAAGFIMAMIFQV